MESELGGIVFKSEMNGAGEMARQFRGHTALPWTGAAENSLCRRRKTV